MARSDGAAVRASTSARTDLAGLARAWLLPLALGVTAVLLSGAVKLPFQLAGHNALFWVTGLALARLLSANELGGTTAGAGAILGAVANDPLGGAEIAAAGIALDVALAFRPLPSALWLPTAGAAANLSVLAAKLVIGDVPHAIMTRGLDTALASYAVFGAIGAAIAGTIALTTRDIVRRRAG